MTCEWTDKEPREEGVYLMLSPLYEHATDAIVVECVWDDDQSRLRFWGPDDEVDQLTRSREGFVWIGPIPGPPERRETN